MAKIIPRAGYYEVIRNDGSSKRFEFDDNASRRAISGKPTRKRVLIEAKTYAGKGHTMERDE